MATTYPVTLSVVLGALQSGALERCIGTAGLCRSGGEVERCWDGSQFEGAFLCWPILGALGRDRLDVPLVESMTAGNWPFSSSA